MSPALHLKQFGKYEIIRKLGRSMTDVYLALDSETNRRVVLKLIEHSHDPYTQIIVEAERRGALIQKELHALDPRILQIYDYGDENDCLFVVMEYVEGQNLADILRIERRLEPQRAARYAIEVCSQLQTLHLFQADIDGRKRAVVHGDIKPSNIQIGPNDEVRLLDFGIAKAITSTHNLTHHNLGSPAYCSPERVKNAQVDQHADLWALGASLYEMVGGLPPYQAQNTRKLDNIIQSGRPPRALPDDCPRGLKAVIAKAIAANLDHRYASAADFEHDLRLFLQNRPTTAETERMPAWDSNATVEKALPPLPKVRIRTQKLALSFMKVSRTVWEMALGLLIGLVIFLPAGYVYRLWTQSAPLRVPRDYVHRSLSETAEDWRSFESLEQQSRFLGHFSPAGSMQTALHASFAGAGNEIIERYRNSPDPAVENFDWAKAQICLTHALDLQPSDNDSRGKLALCNGYAQLAQNPNSMEAAQKAKTHFEQAASYIPHAPDPHLGLARIYIYAFHNVGQALGEFRAAERAGFRLGPRESEEQGDGYLFRAEQELLEWKKAAAKRSTPEQSRYLTLARRDLERARDLYEPMTGFSNVSGSLQRLYRDEGEQQALEAALQKTKLRVKPKHRSARYRRWQ